MKALDTIAEVATLFGKLDLRKIGSLAQQVDINALLEGFKNMKPQDLQALTVMLGKSKNRKARELPLPNGDFYSLTSTLSPEHQAILSRVRTFMREEVAPRANEFWLKGQFPEHIIPKLAALNICGAPYKGFGCPGLPFVLEGFIAEEMARVDVSTCTFFGVQSGLAMGSIYLCGSEQQKQEYLPRMQKMELLGAFGLTEPDVGSAAAGGLTTICKREGDTWTLTGQKKWIGNATFADFTIIWAKDEDDHQVKGFIVDRSTPGFKAEKIEDKMALRTVQNALITLDNVKVSEERRLQNANHFKDVAAVLRMTRAGVAWQAVGCARGAYEHSVKYCQERVQFGRPIGGFQLVQNMLANMVGQLTAMQTMVWRLSQMQDQGILRDEHASAAKVFCTVGCREVVSRARELLGGNGILLANNVARFVADAEAIYSYEGTAQVNSLIVGRAVTGFSAFV